MYLQELELPHELSTEIVYEVSKVHQFPEYLITGFIDELEDFHFNNDLQISKIRVDPRAQLLLAGRALPFLKAIDFLDSEEDIAELMLVSKYVFAKVKTKVYKKLLHTEHNSELKQLRIWSGKLCVSVRLCKFQYPIFSKSYTGPYSCLNKMRKSRKLETDLII